MVTGTGRFGTARDSLAFAAHRWSVPARCAVIREEPSKNGT
jgi:hypothetical protein